MPHFSFVPLVVSYCNLLYMNSVTVCIKQDKLTAMFVIGSLHSPLCPFSLSHVAAVISGNSI